MNNFSAIEKRTASALATVDASVDDKDEADVKSAKPSCANELIKLVIDHCDLFHDERNDGYAVVTHNEIRRTLKLRGKEFRRWLAGRYYSTTEKAANNEAIATAMSVLEAKATFDGRMLELSNRFAMRDGEIYIDMADDHWRVIKITAQGWEVMSKPPVLFRRYSHQKALPNPARGGRLSAIHNYLAIKADDDKLLVEAWLVACCFPDIPRPAIAYHGPQGASKTTSARIQKSITDPSLTESIDLGKTPADLAQTLDHHGVPCFDNLTSIPGWAADMLCRAVTGGAFSKRELYSDDSDIILSFIRPMIITGINIPTHAPDRFKTRHGTQTLLLNVQTHFCIGKYSPFPKLYFGLKRKLSQPLSDRSSLNYYWKQSIYRCFRQTELGHQVFNHDARISQSLHFLNLLCC